MLLVLKWQLWFGYSLKRYFLDIYPIGGTVDSVRTSSHLYGLGIYWKAVKHNQRVALIHWYLVKLAGTLPLCISFGHIFFIHFFFQAPCDDQKSDLAALEWLDACVIINFIMKAVQ